MFGRKSSGRAKQNKRHECKQFPYTPTSHWYVDRTWYRKTTILARARMSKIRLDVQHNEIRSRCTLLVPALRNNPEIFNTVKIVKARNSPPHRWHTPENKGDNPNIRRDNKSASTISIVSSNVKLCGQIGHVLQSLVVNQSSVRRIPTCCKSQRRMRNNRNPHPRVCCKQSIKISYCIKSFTAADYHITTNRTRPLRAPLVGSFVTHASNSHAYIGVIETQAKQVQRGQNMNSVHFTWTSQSLRPWGTQRRTASGPPWLADTPRQWLLGCKDIPQATTPSALKTPASAAY